MKRGEPVPAAQPAPAPAHSRDDAGRPPAADGEVTAAAVDPAEPAAPAIELPKLEDLTASSDFTVFLQKGVPLELQRLALRRAWSLDPAIRDFIEVAENQYDWNAVDGVPGFGPLDPGTDLQRLLAQATGQPLPADPETLVSDATVSQPSGAETHTSFAAQNELPADGIAETDKSRLAGDETTADPDLHTPAQVPHQANKTEGRPEPDQMPHQPAPYRRRHGGALPT